MLLQVIHRQGTIMSLKGQKLHCSEACNVVVFYVKSALTRRRRKIVMTLISSLRPFFSVAVDKKWHISAPFCQQRGASKAALTYPLEIMLKQFPHYLNF